MRKTIILGIVLVLLSCQVDDSLVEHQIQGDWNWSETKYAPRGGEPITFSPTSTDTVMVFRIMPGRLEIVKNDRNMGTFSYTLQKVGTSTYINIDYQNYSETLRMEEGPISFDNGLMHIAGGYDDTGGYQTLKRIK